MAATSSGGRHQRPGHAEALAAANLKTMIDEG
jgi:hypothetical protein